MVENKQNVGIIYNLFIKPVDKQKEIVFRQKKTAKFTQNDPKWMSNRIETFKARMYANMIAEFMYYSVKRIE